MAEDRLRFQVELEFVQALASPVYLNRTFFSSENN